eukprot:14016936-Alexandrium_andersonii.AAC.1
MFYSTMFVFTYLPPNPQSAQALGAGAGEPALFSASPMTSHRLGFTSQVEARTPPERARAPEAPERAAQPSPGH